MTDKKQNKQLPQSEKVENSASRDGDNKAPETPPASADAASKASPPSTAKPAPSEPVTDTINKPSSPPPAAAATSQTPARSGALKGIALVLILLIVVSVAGGFWLWQQILGLQQQQLQVSQQQQQLQREASTAFAEIKGIQTDTLRTTRTLSEQRDDLGQQLADLAQQRKRLQQLDLKIDALSDRRPGDWLLAEANYLTTLAGRRLWLEHDVATSISLLMAADQRIAQMHDPSLVNLRQALADDIATLRSLPRIDKEALALQLNALQRQVQELPIASIDLPESLDEPAPNVVSADTADWRQNLLQTWEAFADGFITVRERSGPVEPLMAPQQRWFLVENLKTKLLQAQLALYREQQLSWQDSLGQAISWTEGFFEPEHPATRAMLAQLTDLSQQPIAPNYPADLTIRSLLEDALAERAGASTAAAPVVTPQTAPERATEVTPEQAPSQAAAPQTLQDTVPDTAPELETAPEPAPEAAPEPASEPESESTAADAANQTSAPPTLMTPNAANTAAIETESAPISQADPAAGGEPKAEESMVDDPSEVEPAPEPDTEQEQQI